MRGKGRDEEGGVNTTTQHLLPGEEKRFMQECREGVGGVRDRWLGRGDMSTKARECVNVGVRIVEIQRLEERQVGGYAGRLQYHTLNLWYSKCSLLCKKAALSSVAILEKYK